MCKKFSFLVSCILVLSLVSSASAVIGQKDIDSPGIPGTATEVAGVWTITGTGHDIWGTGDALHYVYRPLAGDGELVVDLISRTPIPPTNSWSKVGIMIRETSDTSSKQLCFVFTGQADGSGNEYQIPVRDVTGGGSWSVDTGLVEMPPRIDDPVFPGGPQTLKLIRAGDTIQCWWYKYVTPFLSVWTFFGQADVPMNSDVLIGMAVCSHDNAAPVTAVFENVVWPAGPYEKAWDMLPIDGAGPLPVQPELTWMRGDSAAMHDIYLGTDPAALVHVATRPVGVESYIPDPLAEGKTYYWQIIEQPLAEAGPIYSFKTARPPEFGKVQRCVWEGIGGTNVYDLTSNPAYPASPSWCDELTVMGYTDFADNYGARMQGYLVPDTSGDYTFWIAGDDSIELWLSTDEDSCNLAKIAEHVGWTSNYNWFDAPEQQSAAIPLVAGQKYLIRSLHKEGGGGDGCQVAWSGPDQPVWPIQGNSSAMIDGYFLMLASDPRPSNLSPDGITVTPLEAEEPVTWGAGDGAVAHNVYFGPSPGSMALIATVPMPDTSFVLPAIPVGTTGYWAVEADDGTQTYMSCSTASISVEEWISIDIGRANPDPPGSSSYDPVTGEYTLNITGNFELWGQNDEFHYLYTTVKMTRDTGSIKARVLGIEQPNNWRRAGVMIRETTAANSRKVMSHKTGHDNTRMQWREQPGWDTWNTGDNWGLGFPMWVRLDRDGENYNGYRSYDGQNWTHLGGVWCPMQSDKYVCIGLALCHHPNVAFGEFTTAKFDNLEIYTPDPLASWNPSPGDSSNNIPLDVTLSWNAGEGANGHLLYISQNYEDVLYGLIEPIVVPEGTTEYHVGKLELGKRYYWTVDEARREGRDVLIAFGEIWNFGVEPYRLLDDFEAYCVAPEPLPDQVEVPGDVIVAAVAPPEQAWIDPVSLLLVEAVDPGTDCLIAEWAFEDNYDDTSGSGFNGTPMGGVSIIDDAERGKVGSFDGVDGYVDCGNPAALNFGTNDWTISAWIKTSVTGRPKGHIIANGGDGSGGVRYAIASAENKDDCLTLVCDDNSSKKQSASSTKITDGVWHHVVGLRRGDRQYVYVDGVEEDSDGLPAGYDLSGTAQVNVLLGAIYNNNGDNPPYVQKFYTGEIDDARIYDCALTEGNIRYLAGLGDLTLDRPGYFGPMIAHYDLDEGSGTTAADSSGNGLDAAISGALYSAVTADGSAACLDFNGFGDHAINELAGPYLEGLYEMSISLWIQSDLIDTDKGFIILADSSSDRHGMRYDTTGGDGGGDDVVKYGVMTSGGNEEDESSAGLQTTEWQHLVLSWKSGEGIKLYVNGVPDIPSSDKGPVTGYLTSQTRITLGKGGKDRAADAGWDGRIDDVRIYGRRLSQGEARYLAGVGDLLAPSSYQPLIGHWEAEGTADDSSGNGNHGTPVGDATIVMDPVMGLVGSFDGNGDAINVGNSPLFNPGTSDFSIAAWINMSSYGGNWGNCIVGKRGEGGLGWQLRRLSDTQRISFTTRNCGDQDGWGPGGTNVSLNEWHHVAAVRQGTQKWLYVDGKKEAVSDICDNITACDHDVYIGARANGSNTGPEAFFNGMIDDVRIYRAALTLEQVMNFMGCENPIGNTWFGNGTTMPQLDYEVAHGGNQSMRLVFGGPFQVMRIPPFEDWTAGNARALTMYFKGDADNTPGQLFVQLQGGCTVEYSGSPDDLMNPDWQEWNIDLADFPCAVTPATMMSVGTSGGSGVLRFDDMRLYPSRCVPSLSSITDLNQDCSVNGKDLRILVGDYLMGDSTIYPEAPDDAGLLASYQFEDNYDDSSGNGNHGTPVGAGITIEDDPTMGKVLSLPGGDNIFVDCNGVGISGGMPRSIACWAKADHTSIPDWTLVFGFTGNETGGGGTNTHFNIGSLGGPGGVGAHVWGWEDTIFNDNDALDWRHYAMTYDGDLLDYYGDGMLIGTVSRGALVNHDRVFIGSRVTQASSFPGKVDDARIYNYDLSYGEVRSLAGQGDLYIPLESIANIYDTEPANSKSVNLKDYALIGNDWLFEVVWP
ncbi:MAG: LamG-like jellyroll fold domain-containing protein [Planctomycetota bacterium]|jgi:hypothetical protein